MKKANLGCGPHYFEDWDNIDLHDGTADIVLDVTQRFPISFYDEYNFVLINHTLCVLDYDGVVKCLENAYNILEDGGVVEVIDADFDKALRAYEEGNDDFFLLLPDKSIDEKFCRYISGYYERKSVFTYKFLAELLYKVGFKNVKLLENSEYDLRPKESLIVQGTK